MITMYPNCAHLLNSHVHHLLCCSVRPCLLRPVYANCGLRPVSTDSICLRGPVGSAPRPVSANFALDLFTPNLDLGLFTRPMGRSVYAVPFTRTAASDLLTRTSGTRAAAYGPSSPLIPTSHYAPSHSDAGSRRDNIRRHIGFRSPSWFRPPTWAPPSWFPVTIDMGDVTSGPSIDIRLKLNFKMDIYELKLS